MQVLRMTIFTAAMMLPLAAGAESAPDPNRVEARPLVGYDRGLYLQVPGGTFEARPGARVQLRTTLERVDGDTSDTDYDIKRARLFVGGHAITKQLTYKFQADFGERQFDLKDAYIDYAFLPGLRATLGRFKRSFSRQQLTSSGSTELVDRAITDKMFAPGRDWGLQIHNGISKSPQWEYAIGVFNGHGTDGYLLTDADADSGLSPAVVARFGYNHGDLKGYSEADLEGGDLRFGVATNINADLEDNGTGWRGGLDGIVKLQGLSATGGFYGATTPNAPRALGTHLQAGYVIRELLQPSLRFAHVAAEGPNNDRQEILGGLSVYLLGHRLKFQAEAGALLEQEPGVDSTTWIGRGQLQVVL